MKEGARDDRPARSFTVYDRSDLAPGARRAHAHRPPRSHGRVRHLDGRPARAGARHGRRAAHAGLAFTVLSLHNVELRALDWNVQALASYPAGPGSARSGAGARRCCRAGGSATRCSWTRCRRVHRLSAARARARRARRPPVPPATEPQRSARAATCRGCRRRRRRRPRRRTRRTRRRRCRTRSGRYPGGPPGAGTGLVAEGVGVHHEPAAWASATKRVGGSERPVASRGITYSFGGDASA